MFQPKEEAIDVSSKDNNQEKKNLKITIEFLELAETHLINKSRKSSKN